MPLADATTFTRPEGVECPKWRPTTTEPKSKRCYYYIHNGGCGISTWFMCVEFLQANHGFRNLADHRRDHPIPDAKTRLSLALLEDRAERIQMTRADARPQAAPPKPSALASLEERARRIEAAKKPAIVEPEPQVSSALAALRALKKG